MPDYTEEQRAIIRRMGAITVRIDIAMEADRVAHVTMSHELVNLGVELSTAMRRSNEIHRLLAQHGDMFREFLDTL
jgi:hypothetical protein